MIGTDKSIILKPETHQYFDADGIEFTSVSRLLDRIAPSFDREAISLNMARQKSAEEGTTLQQAQDDILKEWDAKRDSSIGRGNRVHENIESFLTIGTCDADVEPAAKRIARFVSSYHKYYPEIILHSRHSLVAGTSDLALIRQRTTIPVVDFFDFKTNESKGIVFDSIKRENGKVVKHYNSWYLPPFEHLEYCNYTHYSLQLSLYAKLAQETYNVRIGRLGILFIDNNYKIRMFPVPYMRMEAEKLLEMQHSLNNSSWEG